MFKELLGEHLLQHEDPKEISTDDLTGKTVALYFSAHWCGPCREFTPKLVEFYRKIDEETKKKFEIVFVSIDKDPEQFDEYFEEMPWKALPFAAGGKELRKKFEVNGIPSLVVLSPTGEVLVSDAVGEIRMAPDRVLSRWLNGKGLFHSREPRDDEYVWECETCSECFLTPLLGSRFGCLQAECRLDLCGECRTKKELHEHPLFEYLIPKREYSLKEMFVSIPHLIEPKTKKNVETKTLCQDEVKAIGLYFSASWCPPCRDVTRKLEEIFVESRETSSSFRFIFVSCDRNQSAFEEYQSSMSFPSVPFNAGTILQSYFQVSGVPSLIVLSSDGKVLTRRGREEISRCGLSAIQTWAKGETLPPPTADEFEWSNVSCDGCGITPLIGRRYFCSTCGDFDVCSDCEKKGHDHPLILIPQPNE